MMKFNSSEVYNIVIEVIVLFAHYLLLVRLICKVNNMVKEFLDMVASLILLILRRP